MPAPAHLANSEDLVTSHEATRAGFLALALERNRLSSPFVAQALALRTAAISAGTIDHCISDVSLRPAILVAAGVSDKAAKHFNDDDKRTAVMDLVERYLRPAGKDFVDELVYRFLLTRGDAIGGAMRNVGGQLAQRKLVRAVASALEIVSEPYYWLDRSKTWRVSGVNQAEFEIDAQGLNWISQSKNRTLLFNRRVPTAGTNVDLCLLNCNREQIEIALRNPGAFVALGELKGGIDPAGADEHWKTARAALTRIHTAFSDAEAYPYLFFIGAAIARNMATEIWGRLQNDTLANAANLTDSNQMAAIAQWIRTL